MDCGVVHRITATGFLYRQSHHESLLRIITKRGKGEESCGKCCMTDGRELEPVASSRVRNEVVFGGPVAAPEEAGEPSHPSLYKNSHHRSQWPRACLIQRTFLNSCLPDQNVYKSTWAKKRENSLNYFS